MGFPMAGCVARAEFDASAYDINPARSEALTTEGVKPTASINEAASGADVFIIMVATTAPPHPARLDRLRPERAHAVVP